MSVYNLVGLRYNGRFNTGSISQYHQHLVSKGSVGLIVTIIGRVVTIWDKVFFKIGVYFYGMVIRKKVFSESIHILDTHIDVVVEVIEIHISVLFEFCIDEDSIGFWWADLVFGSPHATNFHRISALQWRSPLFSREHSGRIMSLW